MNKQPQVGTQREIYVAPSMVEYGSVVKLTQGEYCSTCWDVGAGFKMSKPR
jgi:hypothetical protein